MCLRRNRKPSRQVANHESSKADARTSQLCRSRCGWTSSHRRDLCVARSLAAVPSLRLPPPRQPSARNPASAVGNRAPRSPTGSKPSAAAPKLNSRKPRPRKRLWRNHSPWRRQLLLRAHRYLCIRKRTECLRALCGACRSARAVLPDASANSTRHHSWVFRVSVRVQVDPTGNVSEAALDSPARAGISPTSLCKPRAAGNHFRPKWAVTASRANGSFAPISRHRVPRRFQHKPLHSICR